MKTEESKDLVPINKKTVLEQYSSENGLDDVIRSVKSLVGSFNHDRSTGVSRSRTASLAARVSSFKVTVDTMGKDLTAEWAKKKKAVDVNRKKLRDALDALRDEARKPLTEWEAEQARIEAERKAEEEAKALALKVANDHEMAILMNREHDRLIAERLKTEEEKRLAAEAEAKRLQEEREREIAQRAREQAEREKIQAEQREAAALAQIEAQNKAAEAERKRIADEAAKAKKLAANKAHRKKINSGALLDLVRFGLDKEYAQSLIKHIAEGGISHISINY